jgi:hypothetical protein
MMNSDEWTNSLKEEKPPEDVSLPLQALWWEQKGDWHQAHELAQQADSPEGDWVHAYLHRREGDEGNAGYWYSRAGKPCCQDDLDTEWLVIANELLSKT